MMILKDPDTGIEQPSSRWDREYLNRRFREVLTDLAIHFQYMGKPQRVA